MTLLAPKVKIPPARTLHNQDVPGASFPNLVILREGIRWSGGVGSEPLRLELDVENSSDRHSPPRTARVEVAPFGVFLPWKPLTTVALPSLPPRGRLRMTATVKQWGLPTLPARAFLLNSAFRRGQAPGSTERIQPSQCPHFVGNLNVFVNRSAPVERHVKRAIGLRPGRENFALFVVGDGKRDRYTFSVAKQEAGWALELAGIPWDRPVEITSGAIALCVRPPPQAESGRVSILVHRESTRRRVPVEFELEAGASGSKCYLF